MSCENHHYMETAKSLVNTTFSLEGPSAKSPRHTNVIEKML